MDSGGSDRGRDVPGSAKNAGNPCYNGSTSPEEGLGNSRERRAARRALQRQQTDEQISPRVPEKGPKHKSESDEARSENGLDRAYQTSEPKAQRTWTGIDWFDRSY